MNISYIEEKLKDAKFTFLCKTRKELNEKIFFLVIQFRHLERRMLTRSKLFNFEF